jgi:hypothetical protein
MMKQPLASGRKILTVNAYQSGMNFTMTQTTYGDGIEVCVLAAL